MNIIRFFTIFLLTLLSVGASHAQPNSDTRYERPLKEVLSDVSKRYKLTLKYPDSLVTGKMVTYAEWKYRPGTDETLDNILRPFELKAKKEKEGQYKIGPYEYYRWNITEGWAEMDRIAGLYQDLNGWEQRRQTLIPCIREALGLATLPERPATSVITTPIRKYDGYTVENLAIEILPGLWINGSLYRPSKYKGRIPVILNPDGHWEKQRYRPDCQIRCAALARMGAMAFSYDLFAWGESLLQFKLEDHRRSLAMTIQALGSIRILDHLLARPDADTARVAITGGSGGGSHTELVAAIDPRIKASAPVVSLSSYFYGGCPCESGMDIHGCGGRTNNVEIAALAAPRPQLVVSDGGDWTDRMPEHDLPYLQRMYRMYGAEDRIHNVHLPAEKHDFGINKRKAVYRFMAKYLSLDSSTIINNKYEVDESFVTIEPEQAMYVFGDKGEKLPGHAIKGFEQLEKVFTAEIEKAKTNKRYKIGLIDLMLLKRQKAGAITLTSELKADGVEVDMGGLGNRPTFDNALRNDSIRNSFLKIAKDNNVEIFALGMSGYYAQSFCGRDNYRQSISDCIETMTKMNVKMAFLPLGVQCDLKKNPAVRDSVVVRLREAGRMAEAAGVAIAIETALSAKEEVRLLKDIGSPAIRICFNLSNPLKEGRDPLTEIKTLGRDRIALIHITNRDSLWLENDPQVDLPAIKRTLDAIDWRGWLVVERSRDARKPSDTRYNYGANVRYLRRIFGE
jgi:sugar phosphate isomerase/epimerase/dienelactone hydrolase